MQDEEILEYIREYIKTKSPSELAFRLGYRTSHVFYRWFKHKRIPRYLREPLIALVVPERSVAIVAAELLMLQSEATNTKGEGSCQDI